MGTTASILAPTNGASPAERIVAGCLDSCDQCIGLVEALDDDQYTLPISGKSPIGAHVRHCIDHFLCFFRGLDDRSVDYDARERDPAIETDRRHALRILAGIRSRLLDLGSLDPALPVTIRMIPAPGAEAVTLPSRLDRELLFLVSHTIHHLAIMRLGANVLGVSLPEECGVAYSTRAHRDSMAKGR